MPEGHTIHRLARDHHRWFAGDRPSVGSPQGRFADQAAALDGHTFLRAEAHGKHLAHVWDHPHTPVVHIHLGLFGRARSYKTPGPSPRDTTRLLLAGTKRSLHLIGPNTCELLTAEAWQAVLAAVLLDQKVMSGLGNVYRAEILFMLGLDPWEPAHTISLDSFQQLWELSVSLLQEGVRTNRILTAPPDEPVHPEVLRRPKDRIYVYKRRRCRRCATGIQTKTLEGRTLYWCPSCQAGKSTSRL